MTAARVKFQTIDTSPCQENEPPARFSFVCVGWNKGKPAALYKACPSMCQNLLIAAGPHSAAHGIKRDPQGQNGGRPQWDWNGDRANPTFNPSINCESYCGWHGYIRNGRCVSAQGVDEPEPA